MSNQAPPPPPPPGGGSYGTPPPPPGDGGDQPPVYGGGQPPSYGGDQPSWGGGAPQAKTSGLAIASLVTGILSLLGFCLCPAIIGIIAVVLGVLGRRDIASSGGAKTGSGMAMAGLVMGAIGALLGIGWIILVAVSGSFDWNYTTG